MKALVAAVCLLAACGDARLPATEPAETAQPRLRVMSYNVNFGIAGDPSTIAAISAAQADVVFLQETTDAWQFAIAAELADDYPHRHFDPPDSKWIAGGMGVLSRYPLVSVTKLPPPAGGLFFAWRAVVDTPLGRIQVFNVHLRPPMSDGGSWVVGFWSTRDDRRREIEHHLEAYDPKLPTLFVGDFNEEGDGKAIALLKDRGFTDAIAAFHGNKSTWSWQVRGGVTLRFQLDHILHDMSLVPISSAIADAGRSDHKPIWADFVRMDP